MKCRLIPLSTEGKWIDQFASIASIRAPANTDLPLLTLQSLGPASYALAAASRQGNLRQARTYDEFLVPMRCRNFAAATRSCARGRQVGSFGAAISTSEGRCFILRRSRCARSPAAAEQLVRLFRSTFARDEEVAWPAFGIARTYRPATFPMERLVEYPRGLPKLYGPHFGAYFKSEDVRCACLKCRGKVICGLSGRTHLARSRWSAIASSTCFS
jgi:hypothetical protein